MRPFALALFACVLLTGCRLEDRADGNEPPAPAEQDVYDAETDAQEAEAPQEAVGDADPLVPDPLPPTLPPPPSAPAIEPPSNP